MKVVREPPDDIIVDPNLNPRRILFHSEEDESIFISQMKRAGPETVEMLEVFQETEKTYKLHSGYRRLHAAKVLKWDKVPCRVLTTLSDQDAFCRAIQTNYHRNNLDGYSLATSIAKLSEDFKLTQNQIADRLSMSQGYISEILTVNNFKELLTYLKKGGQIARATALARITNDDLRFGILVEIDNYTVAQLRQIAKDGHFHAPKEDPVESPTEALEEESEELTESREADEIDDYTVVPSHSSDVHPIPTPGDDNGEDEVLSHQSKVSPLPQDDGSGELVGENAEGFSDDETKESFHEPSTSQEPPSEWKQVWRHSCGQFVSTGHEKRQHEKECECNGNYGNLWKGIHLKIEDGTRLHTFSHKKGIPAQYDPENMSKEEIDASLNWIQNARRGLKNAEGFLKDKTGG